MGTEKLSAPSCSIQNMVVNKSKSITLLIKIGTTSNKRKQEKGFQNSAT